MKLSLRLLVLVLLAAVPVFTVQIYRGLAHREERQVEMANEALRIARLVAEQQDRLIDGARHLLTIDAQLPEVRTRNGPECSARLTAFQNQFPEIKGVGAATPDGNMFCFGDSTKPFSIADRDYFRDALRTGTFAVSGYLKSRISGDGRLNIAYAARDPAGNVQAVLVVAFSLTEFGEALARTPLPPNAAISLVDRHGVLLARMPKATQWTGQPVRDPSFMQTMVARREGMIVDEGIDGSEQLFGYAAVAPAADLFVTVSLPWEGIFDAANASFWKEAGILALIFALAAGSAMLGGEFAIRRPIAHLQRMVARMAKGDLAAHAPARHRGIPEIAQLTSDVTAMATALQGREESLHASKQRFRDIAESASDWIWETDSDHRFIFFSNRLTELSGTRGEDILGRRPDELLAKMMPPGNLQAHLDDLANRRPFRNFSYCIDTPAGWRCFSISGRPVFDTAGRFLGYRGTGADVTEQVQAEAALRESDERLRAALSASGTGTFRWDIRSNAVEWDESLARLFGLPAASAVHHIDEFIALAHADDRDLVRNAVQSCAREGTNFDLDFRVVWPDGNVRWLADRGQTFFDDDGRPLYMTGACVDITERKQAEKWQSLLMAELDHRVKNTLATVQSVAMQTLDRTQAVASFRGRLRALAHAHSLLAQSRWKGAGLRSLIEQELAPFRTAAADRILVCGEDVLLTPMAAQTLTLTMHELTTNAAKYGALSSPQGRVEITWRVAGMPDDRRLLLHWVERCGPPVIRPARLGFGATLIQRSVSYELEGTVRLEFLPDGVRCDIEVPLQDSAPAPLFIRQAFDGAAGPPEEQQDGRVSAAGK